MFRKKGEHRIEEQCFEGIPKSLPKTWVILCQFDISHSFIMDVCKSFITKLATYVFLCKRAFQCLAHNIMIKPNKFVTPILTVSDGWEIEYEVN